MNYDNLFNFVNNMYTLHDEGHTRKSSYKDANECLQEEAGIDGDCFDSKEEYLKAWDKFKELSKFHDKQP